MSNKKKNKASATKTNKDNSLIKNIIFIIAVIIIICLVFVLSLNIGNKDKNSNFDISEYTNITSIGLYEFEASFNHDGISVFLFCNTEEEKCQNEIKVLDEIGKEKNISFEYLNVIELVDSEIERLENISDIFKKQKYPNLIIMKSGEIVNNTNKYAEKEEIERILKENEVI